jgi:hypothetical protein
MRNSSSLCIYHTHPTISFFFQVALDLIVHGGSKSIKTRSWLAFYGRLYIYIYIIKWRCFNYVDLIISVSGKLLLSGRLRLGHRHVQWHAVRQVSFHQNLFTQSSPKKSRQYISMTFTDYFSFFLNQNIHKFSRFKCMGFSSWLQAL